MKKFKIQPIYSENENKNIYLEKTASHTGQLNTSSVISISVSLSTFSTNFVEFLSTRFRRRRSVKLSIAWAANRARS